MNFSELRFWLLLLAGLGSIMLARVAGRYCFRGLLGPFDRAALGCLGLFLLLEVSWLTFLIFAAVVLTTWLGLLIIQRYLKGTAAGLALLVPLQLAPLFYYKYASFFTHDVLGFNITWVRDFAIPVGISFYSFQMVSFAVDTLLLKKPIPSLLDCLNYIGFFPQIVAGPIERREDLLPQVQTFRFRYHPEWLDEGISWIVPGLFFNCVLADNIAEYFDRSPTENPFAIWNANLIFALRIYFDFAGYSLVALGLGKCLGVRLTLNFQSPYLSASPVEFWRRWHITLSQWFRDYVYVPLGGSRVRWWAFNIGVVFLLSGIWHGAGWNFVIWGLLHAIFLILSRLMPHGRAAVPAGWLLTQGFVLFRGCFSMRPGRKF